jgi:hypothetical protein
MEALSKSRLSPAESHNSSKVNIYLKLLLTLLHPPPHLPQDQKKNGTQLQYFQMLQQLLYTVSQHSSRTTCPLSNLLDPRQFKMDQPYPQTITVLSLYPISR